MPSQFDEEAGGRNTSPYDPNFQQLIVDDGVFPPNYRHPDGRWPSKPQNWDEICQRLSRPRASLSLSEFSEEDIRDYTYAADNIAGESLISALAIPIIEGKFTDAKCFSGVRRFTNLSPLTRSKLVPGSPDLYHGARPEQLDRRVRDELDRSIVPSKQRGLPVVPNFFAELKGSLGNPGVGILQACYDGALGARGMFLLQSYRQGDAEFDNNAYTITATYVHPYLSLYTTHLSQPTASQPYPQYHMNILRSWCISTSIDEFRTALTWYRNARDWAKEQGDEAIRIANERAVQSYGAQRCFNRGYRSQAGRLTQRRSEKLAQRHQRQPDTGGDDEDEDDPMAYGDDRDDDDGDSDGADSDGPNGVDNGPFRFPGGFKCIVL